MFQGGDLTGEAPSDEQVASIAAGNWDKAP